LLKRNAGNISIDDKDEMSQNNLFAKKPLVIAALHLPPFFSRNDYPMARLEEYVIRNVEVFVKGGIPAVKLQDETMSNSNARPETIALMSSLGSLIRHEFPALDLGIIIEAHDAIAPIAVAHACDASFVRIKVFVGAMLKSSGIQNGCGITAVDYRNKLGAEHIQILADVHDRTGFPMIDVSIENVSKWAVNTGADGIILTGMDYDQSIRYIKSVRASGVKRPILMGGSVTTENVSEVLSVADGVIVSSSLKKDQVETGNVIKWDLDKVYRFMDAASA
jgi:uncharacterized protein